MDKNYLYILGLIMHFYKKDKTIDYEIKDKDIYILSKNYNTLKEIKEVFNKLKISEYNLHLVIKLKANSVYQDILFTRADKKKYIYMNFENLEEYLDMKDFLIETGYTKQLHIEIENEIMFIIKNEDLGRRLELFWGVDFEDIDT